MGTIQERLDRIEAYIIKQQILNKEVMTIDEASTYLSLSKSALYKMTSKKEISYYVPSGKKIYFRKIQLDNWVFKNKVAPSNNFEIETDMYLRRTPKRLES